MSALWHGHAATSAQAALAFPSTADKRKRARKSQADVLLGMLRTARADGRALELPEIMAVGIAQYGARYKELRDRGVVIYVRHDPELDRPAGEKVAATEIR